MEIRIGKFDRPTGTVMVTFDHAGVQHTRPVNACLTPKGRYHAAGTASRVEDVARGVEAKIDLGVITADPEITF